MEIEDKEKLITHTWLPVFPGFYGTIFDNDQLCDYEIEYIREIIKPEALAECMIEHLYESRACDKYYEEYRQSISKQCVNIICNELRNLDYVEDIDFEELVSPMYYNFVNDSINVRVTFSDENIEKIKIMILEHADEWKEFVRNNYTSRDGFISHHANSSEADEWLLDSALTDSHNAGAVLQFLCNENNITDETLYYRCENEVQIDIDMLKRECIEKGWYVPKNICLDWFRSLRHRFKGKYKFRRRVTLAFSTQYILDTPKQRYIFAVTKLEPVNKAFIVKKIFKIFLFAKLKEEKKT